MPAARPFAHRPLAVGAHARGEEGRALGNKLAAEFIGTFFLVFTAGTATAKEGAGVLAPLAIGAVLMVMVFAGGHVSGAHYNPAVTAAVMIRGKIKPREALAYVTAQVTAGALAGALARAIDGGESAAAASSTWKVLTVEFLFTFALAYVVLNVATSAGTRDNSFYGLAIGFTVVSGALAVGGVSGGAFNPAVVLGDSITGLFPWISFWIYLLAELAGGIAAAGIFLHVGGDTAGALQGLPHPADGQSGLHK
jgi:aquaporin Z